MDIVPVPSLRFGFGGGWLVDEDRSGFLFDASVGAHVLFGRGSGTTFYLNPNLGYRRDNAATPSNLGVLGLGLGLGGFADLPVTLRYAPAFVFGSDSLGFRHGLALSVIEILGVEVSQTYLRGDVNQTARGVQVFIDPSVAFVMLMAVAGSAHGRPLQVEGASRTAPLASGSTWA